MGLTRFEKSDYEFKLKVFFMDIREKLDQRILSFIENGAKASRSGSFEELALEVFQYQFDGVPIYQAYCKNLSRTPENVSQLLDIPAFPTSGFKHGRVSSISNETVIATFYTSGTSADVPGIHLFDNLKLYETACSVSFQDLTPKRKTPPAFLSFIPKYTENPNSSLSYMVDTLAEKFSYGKTCYAFQKNRIDFDQVLTFLQENVDREVPIFIASTTVALWDWLKTLRKKLILPSGSQLFETGGRKGRRYLPSTFELAELAKEYLGISFENYLGEYGMTELSSPSWGKLQNGKLICQSPSWSPIRIVDPESRKEVPIGSEGMVQVFDLANRGSVSALYTGDWARRHKNGFEILGRIVDSELRGCSLKTSLSHSPEQESFQKKFKINTRQQKQNEIEKQKERIQSTKPTSLEETTRALGKLTEVWKNSNSPERKAFEGELTEDSFFSPGSITQGLNLTFQELTQDKLEKAAYGAWAKERPTLKQLAVHIYAGNLPVTGVFSFYASLLTGVPSIHRPSSKGGNLLQRLYQSLKDILPELAFQTAAINTPSHENEITQELFKHAKTIVAQGDDTTLHYLKSLAPSTASFYPYRSGLSFAVIPDPSLVSGKELELMVEDIFIWEQQGCLSPQILFLQNSSHLNTSAFTKKLQQIAKDKAKEWERKPFPRSLAHHFWHTMEHRILEKRELFSKDFSESLLILPVQKIHSNWLSTPGMIQLVEINELHEISLLLNPWATKLSSMAVPKRETDSLEMKKFAEKLKIERLVSLGNFQSPTFAWSQDGWDRLRLYERVDCPLNS